MYSPVLLFMLSIDVHVNVSQQIHCSFLVHKSNSVSGNKRIASKNGFFVCLRKLSTIMGNTEETSAHKGVASI